MQSCPIALITVRRGVDTPEDYLHFLARTLVFSPLGRHSAQELLDHCPLFTTAQAERLAGCTNPKT
jgi:hypothetical protein